MSTSEQDRIILHLDLPDGTSVGPALQEIADGLDVDPDQDSGYTAMGGGREVHWRIARPLDGIALDPRQREAAALLLMAIEPPCDLMGWAQTMLEASTVNPGMTMGEVRNGQRLVALRRARDLIDAMVAEAEGAKA